VGSFVSRSDAALAAGVTPDVVKMWRLRGWLTARGERRHVRHNGSGYLLDDVLEAERDTRRKPERSHRRLAA
jgi:hypothetical protein